MAKQPRKYYCPKCQSNEPLHLIDDDNHEQVYYACINEGCKVIWTKREIENGELKNIMIVGDTSSGKTTFLASLIYHLVHPVIKNYIANTWNIRVTLQPNDPLLWVSKRFNTTILKTNEESEKYKKEIESSIVAKTIFNMYFFGEYPSISLIPGIKREDSEEQIRNKIETYQNSHQNGFFLSNLRTNKKLFVSFLDIPGEGFMREYNQFQFTWQNLAKRIYSSDGNLLLIDPKSLSGIWQKYGEITGQNEPITEFGQVLGTLKRFYEMHMDWKNENVNFWDKFLNKHRQHWSIALTKTDQLEADGILKLPPYVSFNKNHLIDIFSHNKNPNIKFYERHINDEMFRIRAEALKDKLEYLGEKSLDKHIRSEIHFDTDDLTISPVCAFAGHKEVHSIFPSLNVVEVFIHLLKQINFIEDE